MEHFIAECPMSMAGHELSTMIHELSKFFRLICKVLEIHFQVFLSHRLQGRKICLPLQPANEEAGCSEKVEKRNFKIKK
jgi:hypothetical protein